VRLEEPLDALLNSLGFSSANSSKIKQVKSPMPGLVLSISAEVGKEIKKDEPLLILEAMKMENVIKSPTDGVVKSIAVNAGQAVEKGSVMITFE
jgi:biotin carboxyl carrier protein